MPFTSLPSFFNSPKSHCLLALSLSVALLLSSGCKKGTPPQQQQPVPIVGLKDVAPFPVGVAVDPGLLQSNLTCNSVVVDEESSITSQNVLKWASVHPSQNTFDFSGPDYLLTYATTYNKRMHGHNLCWYSYNPDWLNNFTGDSTAWENLLKTHIQTVVSHYKGKITGWDVVNEALRDDGTLRVWQTSPPGGFDDGSIWARNLGRDYIARAFQYAHEADPAALLFYNDYGQEYSQVKIDSIVAMVSDFKQRGIPINGLGIQMHININSQQAGIANAIKQLAATGLAIHISELDISVNPNNNPIMEYLQDIKNQQDTLYAFIVKQYKALVPKGQQYGITTWGVGDADSWIRGAYNRPDWPLLFDDIYYVKEDYYVFMNALKN
jgi:endo-1,4-beta-xylanase